MCPIPYHKSPDPDPRLEPPDEGGVPQVAEALDRVDAVDHPSDTPLEDHTALFGVGCNLPILETRPERE